MFENAPVSRHRKRLGQGLKPHEQGGIYKELKLSEQLQQTLDGMVQFDENRMPSDKHFMDQQEMPEGPTSLEDFQ